MQEDRARERGQRRGKPPRAGLRRTVRAQQLGPRAGRPRGLEKRLPQRERGAGEELGVLVQEQPEAPARAAQELGVVERLAPSLTDGDHLVDGRVRARRLRRAVARAVVEHEHLAGEREQLALARDRVQPAHQELALGGVHDTEADGSISAHTCLLSVALRVHVVDPSAFTPPYDHALCRALGEAGAEVELFTSRFAYAGVPPPDGYTCHELFYRAALGAGGSRLRTAAKLAEHVPDMLRYRRRAAAADVVHFQWLPIQQLDVHLLPAGGPSRPLVLTAHDILPREPRPGQREAQRRLYGRFDAVVVHSHAGAARLTGELGLDPARVHVIPHGVLRPWEGQDEQPLPSDLLGFDGPVVLFFGLLRPYKGIDLLLDAWRELGADSGAELWIVGMPAWTSPR